jgi:hypothetical protein
MSNIEDQLFCNVSTASNVVDQLFGSNQALSIADQLFGNNNNIPNENLDMNDLDIENPDTELCLDPDEYPNDISDFFDVLPTESERLESVSNQLFGDATADAPQSSVTDQLFGVSDEPLSDDDNIIIGNIIASLIPRTLPGVVFNINISNMNVNI